MIFLRARYYNPADGRFQSRDTWGGIYRNPNTLNRWTYANDNPVMFFDPSGHCPWCPFVAIAVVAILISTGATGCASEVPTSENFVIESPDQYTNSAVKVGMSNYVGGRSGLGTLVSNLNTIVTAKHVVPEAYFTDEAELTITSFNDNKERKYIRSKSQFDIHYISGYDLAIIKLSQDSDPLPSSITPAIPDVNYPFTLYDELAAVYQDSGGAHAMYTKIMAERIEAEAETNVGVLELISLEIAESHGIINNGDSGGGIFHDGKLVGVNSATTDASWFSITSIASGQQFLH